MVAVVVGAVLVAPVYWTVVPARARGAALAVLSLAGLAALDPRAAVLVAILAPALAGLTAALERGAGRALLAAALVGLAALFVWNKSGGGLAVLPSQQGAAVLGVSYVVLKAAAALVDAGRGAGSVRTGEALGWLAFVPTYPAGPIVPLAHHRAAALVFSRDAVLAGAERILVGLVKALLAANALGAWAMPIVATPDPHPPVVLAAGLVALTLRFYLDFSGYSDVAIGLGALFGYGVDENFDRPLLRRNLVQLWQRWHMTLTAWLRTYVFVPLSRTLLRRRLPGGDLAALVVAQLVTMGACGLWHGLTPGFVVWGLLHGLGLAWVGVLARPLGTRLPARLVVWWRTSPIALAASTALTFAFFATTIVFAATDLPHARHYLWCLAGGCG